MALVKSTEAGIMTWIRGLIVNARELMSGGSFEVWMYLATLLFLGLICISWISLRRGASALPVILWASFLVVGFGTFSYFAQSRNRLEMRIAELRSDATRPGSILSCLDSAGSPIIDEQCESALFRSADAVRSALLYTEARLAVLDDAAGSVAYMSGRSSNLDWIRRGLETDRFGFVAQALVLAGCTAEKCPQLQLFRNPQQVTANLAARRLDQYVSMHAADWRTEASRGDAPTANTPASPSGGLSAAAPSAAGTPPGINFPSSASIPMLNILKSEPPLIAPSANPPVATASAPPQAPPLPTPAPKRKQPPREQRAQQPGPPIQITPEPERPEASEKPE